ncbi:MAG: DUF354 domain-containing protein [Ignavibacteria bacterium]|nr:DUF354 domain-containing protein [Ignavibacteria bacterium]
MNLLIDICHPAHVHLFRNFIKIMKERGHNIYITVKDIPSAKALLKIYGIRYIEYGKKSDSIIGKTLRQLQYDNSIKNIVNELGIELGIGTSITIAHVSKLTKMKSLVFDDDDSSVEPLFTKFAHPFADYLISPDVLKYERTKPSHICYPGFHELAYLHPKRFTPDEKVIESIGLNKNDRYFILRFNAFKAHHDIGVKGLSMDQKRKLVETLSEYGKIYITTEDKIDHDFEKYQLKSKPDEIFSLLYYATLFVGDSQTMTNEAAVLGTPSLRLNSFVGKISYLEQQEKKYKLAFGFRPTEFNEMIAKIRELLDNHNIKEDWQKKRKIMLNDKIDVTGFLVELIDSYPDSLKYMNNNADYFEKFR